MQDRIGGCQEPDDRRLCRSQNRVWILFYSHGEPLEGFKNIFHSFKKETVLRMCQTLPKWLYHFAFPLGIPVAPHLCQYLAWVVFLILAIVLGV